MLFHNFPNLEGWWSSFKLAFVPEFVDWVDQVREGGWDQMRGLDRSLIVVMRRTLVGVEFCLPFEREEQACRDSQPRSSCSESSSSCSRLGW